jgi:hypothetical protein
MLFFINKDKKAIVQKSEFSSLYAPLKDPLFNKTQYGKISLSLYRGFLCATIGETCTNNLKDGNKNFKNSIFGKVTNLIVMPYANPPASGVYWVHDSLQKSGFVPKTYASEGIGFAAIRPYMGVWKAFRDVAYSILVLVLIAIGFMIMFRMKLNPQTVISVENALPKIVVSLIWITFSFAIAGFLIDAMYVIITVSISLLSNANIGEIVPGKAKELQNLYLGAGFSDLWPVTKITDPFSVGSSLVEILPGTIRDLLKGLLGGIAAELISKNLASIPGAIGQAFSNIGFGVEAATIGGTFFLGKLPTLPVAGIEIALFLIIAGFGGAIIMGVVFCFTLLFFMFRVFFMLLTTYIRILLFIILGPLFCLADAIPGKNAFAYWLKSLFSELLTFPVVIIVLLIGKIILSIPSGQGAGFSPPFLYYVDETAFRVLTGMGLILLIPDIVKLVKEMLGVKPMPLNIGLGTFLAGGAGAVGGAYGGISQMGGLMYTLGTTGIAGKLYNTKMLQNAPVIGDFLKQAAEASNTLHPQHPGGGGKKG